MYWNPILLSALASKALDEIELEKTNRLKPLDSPFRRTRRCIGIMVTTPRRCFCIYSQDEQEGDGDLV